MKQYFEQAGLPWIYEQPRGEVHTRSTYNRKPKGQKHALNFETRIATIRKNLSTQDERLEKLRMERLEKEPLKGVERALALAMKYCLVPGDEGGAGGQAGASGQRAAARRAGAAAEKAAATELGITVAKKK